MDPYMVHNLAACTLVALEYNRNDVILWHKGNHDYVLLRAYRGLIFFISKMVKEGKCTITADKRYYAGNLLIPNWFVQEVISGRRCSNLEARPKSKSHRENARR
ncbi:MAG: hypothetical protein WAW92_02560 [Minisyncoccia bacterium]